MKTGKESTSPNFSSFSPSAKDLLLLKGYTRIPYSRQTSELLYRQEKFIVDYDNKNFMFWARTLHFEGRYWNINYLLSDLEIKNIIEFSSGFSFRGLETLDSRFLQLLSEDSLTINALTGNAIAF